MSSSSMCGPSNPLQNLQKHTSADKTLQQDRLLRRPRSAANFRSSPAPGPSALEAEFEQFSGIPQVPHLQHTLTPSPQPFLHHHAPQHHFSPSPQPQLDGWASDFLNLNISADNSTTSASPLSRAQQKAPALRPSSSHQVLQQRQSPQMSGWGAEFLAQQQQQQQPMMAPGMASQMGMPYGGYAAGSGMYMGNQFGGPVAQASTAAATTQQGDVAAQYTDQDFERMFDEAQLAAAEIASLQEQAAVPLVEPRVEEPVVVEEPKEEEKPEEREDPDELARTAGQLLDTLSTNTSDKFKQSNFLALMRKLRDHEVRIEGGKMVEV